MIDCLGYPCPNPKPKYDCLPSLLQQRASEFKQKSYRGVLKILLVLLLLLPQVLDLGVRVRVKVWVGLGLG